MENYVSLFEYLGKPAGGEIGHAVYKHASAKGVKVDKRMIQTKTYTGKVVLYPKLFLDGYFNDFRKIN